MSIVDLPEETDGEAS